MSQHHGKLETEMKNDKTFGIHYDELERAKKLFLSKTFNIPSFRREKV